MEKNSIKIIEESKKENTRMNSDKKIISKESNIASILFKIKSKFLLKDVIMNYISNKKKLYLFKESKSLQTHLNLSIKDYQEKKLNSIFPLSKIYELLTKKYSLFAYKSEKKERNKIYNNIIDEIKFDKKMMETYMIKKIKEDMKKYGQFKNFYYDIDINSPFFDSFIRTDIIEEFQILIDDDIFENNYLLNDIKNTFEKLNNINCSFPQTAMNLSFKYLNNINDLNLNFTKVKKLFLNYPLINPPLGNNDIDNEYLKKIFSFFQPMNNLEKIMIFIYNPIKAESLEILNTFSNLKDLSLMNAGLEDDDIFTLKLSNLNKLNLSNCKNISFDENKIYNIKILILNNSKIIKPKSLLKFPYLYYLVNTSTEIIPYLDLTKSKNLKTISAKLSEVSKVLNDIPLIENLSIEENKEIDNEKEEDALKKILDNNNLKFIKLSTKINDERIGKINKINSSVKKIFFQNVDNVYNNFLNKFSNLNELEFYLYVKRDNIFEIQENKTCKINKIKLYGLPNGILYCYSFETLKMLHFDFNNRIKNIEKIIPLFSDKCSIVFKSLSDFYLKYFGINDEFLNRLKNNLDFIPYLYSFSLIFNFGNISENCYYDFIKKILSKRINNITINNLINPNVALAKDEIKNFSPKFNFIYHGIINISKFK